MKLIKYFAHVLD